MKCKVLNKKCDSKESAGCANLRTERDAHLLNLYLLVRIHVQLTAEIPSERFIEP